MPFKVVIPARFGSTRLPGKPLLPIAGRLLIEWVYDIARGSGAEEVLIATDHERVATAARAFGAAVLMTSAQHQSGTDRIAEVARLRGWRATTIVVNVQGDEPLLPPALIGQVAALLQSCPTADLATLSTPIETQAEFVDPNAVKVVSGAAGRALYFSRAPIPYERDASADGRPAGFGNAQRHLGIYAYRVAALIRLSALAPVVVEQTEKLEQLRALHHGFDIRVAQACEKSGPDVNSPADLQRVAQLLRR